MNFFKNIPSKYILLIILTIGLIVRIINLTIGFPMLYLSNDEAVFHLSALNIIANKTIFSLGNYGPLGTYIQIPIILLASLVLFVSGKIASISDLEFLLITQDGYFMFIPRVISATFGVLTILVIYKLSLKLFKNKSVALWSAFFVAVSFSLVHVSHFARSLSGALFFTTLSVIFAVESTKDPRRQFKNRLLSFIYAAVAFGFHQIFGIAVIFPLVVTLKTYSIKKFRTFTIPLIIWFLLILIMNYLSLGSKIFEVFKSNNSLGVELIRSPGYWLSKSSPEIVENLLGNIKMFWYLFLAEGLILLFAIYGFLKQKIKYNLKLAFVAFFTTSIFFSVFIFPPVLRYFLPTIVFLPIFAGVAVHRLLQKKHFLLSVCLIAIVSFNSTYWNYLKLQEPTFVQLRKWVEKNIPPETPLVSTYYRSIGYVPSRSASAPIRKSRPGYYLRAADLIGDNYPYNVRNILYLEGFNKMSKIDNLNAGLSVFPAEYIIDAYYRDQDRLIDMAEEFELIAHFTPTEGKIYKRRIPEMYADSANNFPFLILDRGGPYFDILKVEK